MKKKQVKNPIRVSNNVFIRTVTHYYTGRIEVITPTELVLSSAAWIADTKRFHDTLQTGACNEVEPIPGVCAIGRGAIVDVIDWSHPLPNKQV